MKEEELLERLELLEREIKFLRQSPERANFYSGTETSAVEFGSGSYRLDEDGIKFANTHQVAYGLDSFTDMIASDNLFPGLYILPRFDQDIFTEGKYGQIAGYFHTSDETGVLRLLMSAGQLDAGDDLPDLNYANIDLTGSTGGDGSANINLQVKGPAGVGAVSILLKSGVSVGEEAIEMRANWVTIPRGTTTSTGQGDMRYDTGTDKFVGNVNGTEDNFAMEGWVTNPASSGVASMMAAFFFGG